MNEKAKNIIKNIKYTVSANFFVLGISIILNLIVPKFLGINEYSYWQLYVFYSSYVGFFHLGWLDGIYLKIGGAEYDDLDKKNLGSQFWIFALFETIVALCISVYIYFFSNMGTQKTEILLLTAIVLVIMNCKTFILYILQSTNRIREYAQLSRNDRYFYVIFLVLYLILGGRNFVVLIFLDIFSKLILTFWGFYKIKDMLNIKPIISRSLFLEIKDNIKIGSNLMFSNIANMLILGISRFFVEQKWSIETFGKLSFSLSISNMFMTFINAVGIVMFPMLRRADVKNLPSLYLNLRNVFVPITFLLLLFFNPVKLLLEIWLPDYKESLYFMGILFPMIIYDGRMSLLINTYLKTLRKEKEILLVNIIALCVTLVGTGYSVFIMDNITATIIVIVLCLIFRCIFAEYLLSKELNISLVLSNLLELLLVCIFISTNLLFNYIISFSIYCLSVVLFILLNFSKIKTSLRELVFLMKN